MTIFDALNLIGGLSLFLFGMNFMGNALERKAGKGLKNIFGKLADSKPKGVLVGAGVTIVTQSSSATTVMVVGFVNSGIMTLSQAINIIMGANVGTTAIGWILSLAGISSDNIFISLLKPTSFTPIFALAGAIMYMFSNDKKKKELGSVFLGFATLMFGMNIMTDSVSGLSDMPSFTKMFTAFDNPFLGLLVGTVITAMIQSSAASIGILQALAMTGGVSYGAAIPIIMGQNIGTCITAILSSIGATKAGKRAAYAHLFFNVIGTAIWMTVFCGVNYTLAPLFLTKPISLYGIALVHTIFNVLTLSVIAPFSSLLEKFVLKLIPDAKKEEKSIELDERLLLTPPLALERCRVMEVEMAETSVSALKDSIKSLFNYSDELAESVREKEEKSDNYEDMLGTFLVKVSELQISESDSREAGKLLKMIGDFERISDHAVNILESAEEMREKDIEFTPAAMKEIKTISEAVNEILTISYESFRDGDVSRAIRVEPLEQVIDDLKEKLRLNHIRRLQQGGCSIDAGFIWSDLLTNFERTSDHCSNIAGTIVDISQHNLNLHQSLRAFKNDSETYKNIYAEYTAKYEVQDVK